MPWQVVDEDDDVALGEGRRNGRDTTGKRVLKWLASLDKNSIEKLGSIEFINAYGGVDQQYKLKELAEIATKRKQFTNDTKSVKKGLIESRPTGITYTIKKDKGKGKAKEIYQETLKEKHEAIEKIAKKIIKHVKGVLTFTESPKLDYKVNRAPWSREQPPSHEGLNDWKVDLINSIHAVAPEGDDERNHQQRHAAKFNGLRHKSQSLGPNASGPFKQENPTEFFQPRKNSTVKPTSNHPGTTWVNLGTMGWVTHTKQNLVWNIDGYCYLAAINNEGLKNREWPKNPTLYSVSHFHYKYRKYVGFKVYKSTDSKFHLELDSECKLGKGWTEIDWLANQASTRYLRIGGKGLTSKLKEFDGTNYQEWASKMEAYLKTQELWEYVNLITKKLEELNITSYTSCRSSGICSCHIQCSTNSI